MCLINKIIPKFYNFIFFIKKLIKSPTNLHYKLRSLSSLFIIRSHNELSEIYFHHFSRVVLVQQ